MVVCLNPPCDDNYPKFAQVVHVLVPEDSKMLLLKTFNTDSYSQHLNAYRVTVTSHYVIVPVDELALMLLSDLVVTLKCLYKKT